MLSAILEKHYYLFTLPGRKCLFHVHLESPRWQRMQCFQNTGIKVTSQTLSSRILPNTLRNPDSVTTALFGEIIQMMEKLRLREIKWLTWSLMDVYYRKDSPFVSLGPIACSQNLDFSAQASFHFLPQIPLFYKEDHRDSAHPQRHMIVCPISRLVLLVTVVRKCVLFGTCSSISACLLYESVESELPIAWGQVCVCAVLQWMLWPWTHYTSHSGPQFPALKKWRRGGS